ncbi:bifunctional 2-polyprenyl-6-hydroxyphenol methylase/3-demethylubiquinol 3-O-methyltransferase UbiG [Acidocella aminolytica]|jgi:2-polyprenyl-6-hydroxyphenyl methylase/3-demethylubiquinone-9 3-methyltransferase|uniref:Ubiquinone biosynthesis O-methyltransferase n=1 Tax=Acidocella aminolytica 101 = DSM 11237 TaxID=1120923 RepID=A0A0D6PJ48_9PROT|nr:bifunctional 2-polyprenyl-6-hydroxyphenol methylase/3-demethylubiquinol 3-O-methyltransferase UbiG [Acidocella aminolytica]GAN81692.1 3-demethylubiquinone-9 3-methyltransferase [Acidocella aminolytica 101 = DSM 11237]GBQ32882.1 3-demethylubiquinone-9 3-methyltransferase [Acidocella aminolytica 101 = DSM 11237]SHE51208.1 3-demethylubiquinone-9 3-methyltransferase [Acidocella aminolytica 101 = DSM 11237]
MSQGSVIDEEIARFNALAAHWWDANGPMRPLHMMNPVRAAWVAARVSRFRGAGVPILDVGCGAGLLAEALAKNGFAMTGLDAGAEVIGVARGHSEGQGLNLTYIQGTAEALAAEGARFPVVTALEIIEHVANPAAFLASLRTLLEPGGLLFLSTLNRTPRSYAVAKLGAEYVLRLLPVGTHDWTRFIKPEELARLCREAGLRLADTAGLSYSPLAGGFKVSRDLSVNYIAMAVAD